MRPFEPRLDPLPQVFELPVYSFNRFGHPEADFVPVVVVATHIGLDFVVDGKPQLQLREGQQTRVVVLVEPKVFEDARGYFMETWRESLYRDAGIDTRFVQENVSRSLHRNTLRGLHYQLQHPQGKLVRVVAGVVFDVAVDIRRGSPYFGQWVGVTLSAENRLQLYVPPGFAHGFCTLSERADFLYKCTDFYSEPSELGIAWNDPDIGIEWPISDGELSGKDAAAPRLSDFDPARLPRMTA